MIKYILGLILLGSVAHATPAGSWKYNTPETHAWFQTLQNNHWPYGEDHKISCCHEADAEVLKDHGDWKIVDNHYEVLINGNWQEVPGYADLSQDGVGNPTGGAVVFYGHYDAKPTIYCFVLPAMG